jgi:hypothetical protein
MEMDMAHHRASREPAPGARARQPDQAGQIQRVGGHHQFTADPLPGASRPIGVDLDAQVVRILKIQRFADEVVGGAEPGVDLPKVSHQPAERRAVRHEQGKVVEPYAATQRYLSCARVLVQLDQGEVAASCCKHCVWTLTVQHPQPKRGFIKPQ